MPSSGGACAAAGKGAEGEATGVSRTGGGLCPLRVGFAFRGSVDVGFASFRLVRFGLGALAVPRKTGILIVLLFIFCGRVECVKFLNLLLNLRHKPDNRLNIVFNLFAWTFLIILDKLDMKLQENYMVLKDRREGHELVLLLA